MATCPNCSAPVSDYSLTCPHCAAALSPISDRQDGVPVDCPRCSAPCSLVRCGGIELDHCLSCHGLWFDKHEVLNIKNEMDALEIDGLLAMLGAYDSPSSTATTAYPKCPVCDDVMTKTNFARISGIMLYKCNEHGAWADNKEAVRLIKLCGNGGEKTLAEKAARYEKEERENQISRARIAGREKLVILPSSYDMDGPLWGLGWRTLWLP